MLSFSDNCFIMIWYIYTHIAYVFIYISFFYSWQESGTSSQSITASKQFARNWRDFSFGTSYLISESTTMTHSMPQCNSELHVIYSMPRIGEYHYAWKSIFMHVLLNLRSYAIICVIYMHQLDIHVDIIYIYISKRVSGTSTRSSYDETVRYPLNPS